MGNGEAFASQPLGRSRRFFLTQVLVEQKGAEGEDGRDEGEQGKRVVPLMRTTELGQFGDVEQKQESVDRSHHSHGQRHPHKILHRHGDEE